MSKNFPPLTLVEAQTFSVCEFYKTFTICIYVGPRWAYIIYDAAGERLYFNALPRFSWQGSVATPYSWDVPDAIAYCQAFLK